MTNKLAIAGNQLLKGNFGNAITALVSKSTGPSELIFPARYRNGNFFFGINGGDKSFVWGNYNSSLTAYQQCPVVSAIINRKAQCTVNGKRYIMNDSGEESTSPQANNLRRLLQRPNGMQSGMQFEAQGNVYKQIYGYCPVLVIKPVGFESDFSRWKLWNLPPWMVQVYDNQEFFFTDGLKPFREVRLTYMGQSIVLNQDNLFFLKENQIATTIFQSNSAAENVSLFLPDSKLFSVKDNISNFIASLNSRGTLITERGPQWLLTNDSSDTADSGLFPVDPKYKKDLYNDFAQYGILRGQKKAIITDAKLKLQTVGFDVSQLRLLEGEVQDAKTICDQLNYPPELMGLIDSKYDNQNVAERALYTNSIIPDSESEDEQWGEFFGLEKIGLTIQTDFKHLAALQENIAEQGRGRMYMNQAILIEWLQDGITWNRWRELLGEDTVKGMDMYYSDMVKAGKILPPATAQSISTSENNGLLLTPTSPNSNNNGQSN